MGHEKPGQNRSKKPQNRLVFVVLITKNNDNTGNTDNIGNTQKGEFSESTKRDPVNNRKRTVILNFVTP